MFYLSHVYRLFMKNIKFSLKTPSNLSYWWNLGSLISFCMVIQILSGVLLTLYYDNSENCFLSIYMIHIETFYGVYMHFIHLNMASFIFMLIYFHMIKGLLFTSFKFLKWAWISGWMMMLLTMMSAFMGYVLPWGQMSLWGATVITNLLSAIPFVGAQVVQWIWGGYFVSNYTMKLFFTLHFLVPLIILLMIIIHLAVIHYYGSSGVLGNMFILKTEFNPFYLYKDMINLIIIFAFTVVVSISPYLTSDPENFIVSNSMVSPIHIQPEWYFLQYYAILRAIPNKLGGVLMFVAALLLLLLFVLINTSMMLSLMKLWHFMISLFISNNIMLIWLGGLPVESPYLFLSQIFTFLYFFSSYLLFNVKAMNYK